MYEFLTIWANAALTSVGFFWMAIWAFALGYLMSSCIQVFVTRQRMQRAMGKAGARSVALGTFFGFISSSCSFAALSTSKSLFKKGAGLVPSLAFLLASTNLVIELGIIIAIFLSWQFVVGEYVGGILLILFTWVIVSLTLKTSLEDEAREHLGADQEGESGGNDWKSRATSLEGWQMVARQYFMEWAMVWRDVTFGFTVAGVIAAFVPNEFFTTLFVGSGSNGSTSFFNVLVQTIVGPIAAFFTFIGSMGNIPLASLLYANGVSFGGIMAFIFSDLVVFPVLRVNAQYFGWRMALYILGVFLAALVASALLLHYGFAAFGLLPESAGAIKQVDPSERFAIDYTFFLNLAFLAASGALFWLAYYWQDSSQEDHRHEHSDENDSQSWSDRLLTMLAYMSFIWLAGGLIVAGVQ